MTELDRRRPLLQSYENAAVIVSGMTAEQLTLRTPCPAYDVAGLIDHTVEAAHRSAALGRGRTPPAGDVSPQVQLSDAPTQLRRAAEEAAQAWGDDSRLSSSYTMPWGEKYSGATLVDMYLAELAAHAWDLAMATGQLDRLDPSLPVPALDGARAIIKPEYRDMVATGSPFGAEVPPPPDADDWERLAAFMGRDPRGSLDVASRSDRMSTPATGSMGQDRRMSADIQEHQRIPESHRDLVTSTTVALSTINEDGSIQTTAVWVLLDDDGLLRTSLAKNRRKYDNLLARPTANVFSLSPTNPFHTLEVRASAEIADDDAQRTFMAKVIGMYGQTLESMAEQAKEDRVVVTFHPTRVRTQG
jgi:uncharacterized protein (TIGR03086 family)